MTPWLKITPSVKIAHCNALGRLGCYPFPSAVRHKHIVKLIVESQNKGLNFNSLALALAKTVAIISYKR